MNQELKNRINAVVLGYRAEIVAALTDEPTATYESLAQHFGVTCGYVYRLAREHGLRRRADAVALSPTTTDSGEGEVNND